MKAGRIIVWVVGCLLILIIIYFASTQFKASPLNQIKASLSKHNDIPILLKYQEEWNSCDDPDKPSLGGKPMCQTMTIFGEGMAVGNAIDANEHIMKNLSKNQNDEMRKLMGVLANCGNDLTCKRDGFEDVIVFLSSLPNFSWAASKGADKSTPEVAQEPSAEQSSSDSQTVVDANPQPVPSTASSASMNPSPSFNCALARTNVEHTICSDPQLIAADSELNSTYSQLKKDSDLVQAQRAWVRTRNKCTDADCLYTLYKTRNDELSGRLNGGGVLAQ